MPLVFAYAGGISPPTMGRGKLWAGHSSPSESALRLRGGYSPTLVRFTHVCAFASCWEGNRTLCPASNSGGYLGVTISPQE